MSPIVNQGAPCRLCVEQGVVPPRPARWQGLCPACWHSEAWMDRVHSPEREPAVIPAEPVPPTTRFEAMVSVGAAHRAEDPEFEAELRAWTEAA